MADVAAQIAAIREVQASRPAPRRPRHPEVGCICDACVARDDHFETLAEQRDAARRGA